MNRYLPVIWFNVICNFLFAFLAPIFAIVGLIFDHELRQVYKKENLLLESMQHFSELAKNRKASK